MYGSSNYLSYMCAGPDGSALLMYNQRIAVLVDAQGQVQLCEDLQNWWDAPIVLPDGRPAFRGYEGDGSVLRPFNFETKSFDEDISLPYSAYQLYPERGQLQLLLHGQLHPLRLRRGHADHDEARHAHKL